MIGTDDELEEAVRVSQGLKPAILRLSIERTNQPLVMPTQPSVAQKPEPIQPRQQISEKAPAQQSSFNSAYDFISRVRSHFADSPLKYHTFLRTLQSYRTKKMSLDQVHARISGLFSDNAELLEGFKTFLPPGFKAKPLPNRNSGPSKKQMSPTQLPSAAQLSFSIPKLHATQLPSLSLVMPQQSPSPVVDPKPVQPAWNPAPQANAQPKRVAIPQSLGRLASLCAECGEISNKLNQELANLSMSSALMSKQMCDQTTALTGDVMQESMLKSQIPDQANEPNESALQNLHTTTSDLTLSVQQDLHTTLQAQMLAINEESKKVQESQRNLENQCQELFEKTLRMCSDFSKSIAQTTEQVHDKTVGDIRNM